MLSQNVATRVPPPKRTKPALRILTLSEMHRLIEAARGTGHFLPIYLAVLTGHRRSEICGLNRPDADLEAGSLKVVRTMISLRGDRVHFAEPKSRNSRRVVAIAAGVVQTLRGRQAALRTKRGVQNSQVCARPGGDIMNQTPFLTGMLCPLRTLRRGEPWRFSLPLPLQNGASESESRQIRS